MPAQASLVQETPVRRRTAYFIGGPHSRRFQTSHQRIEHVGEHPRRFLTQAHLRSRGAQASVVGAGHDEGNRKMADWVTTRDAAISFVTLRARKRAMVSSFAQALNAHRRGIPYGVLRGSTYERSPWERGRDDMWTVSGRRENFTSNSRYAAFTGGVC